MASSLEARIRLAPSSANRLAMPLPMPRLAPVIRTLFSSNRFMVGDRIFIRYILFIDLQHSSVYIAQSTCFVSAACAIPRRTSDGRDALVDALPRDPGRHVDKPELRRQTSKHALP